MHSCSRRHVTLLELIIAMALVSILMTALLGYYGDVTQLHRQADQLQDETFLLRYVQSRLGYVLPRATPPPYRSTPKEKKNDFYFYSSDLDNDEIKQPSLIFTFDNGFVSDPLFSGTVLARLYLSPEKNSLCLAVWPLPRCWRQPNPPMIHEVLLENVESLSFDFYYPPKHEGASRPEKEIFPKPQDIPPSGWSTSWAIPYQQLPAIVTVKVKRKQDKQATDFSFMLPNCTKPIVIR